MNIGVIGAGAWGTAFSVHLARRENNVLLWAYEPDLCDIMTETRENPYYLPGFPLSPQIQCTNDLKTLLAYTDDIILATPSFALRPTIEKISKFLTNQNILILTKGIEPNTLLFMSQIVEELSGSHVRIAALSGPSFAKEVAEGAFTSVVIGALEHHNALYFQVIVHDDNFRVYTTDDLIGVEVGGAMKNVMAIGAGIIEGLGLGANTLAAFLTRAVAEMKRLGKKLGARETTFMGLSGMGDLILTSYGNLSRNRTFGIELSKGRSPEEIIHSQKSVIEGYYTVSAVYKLSKKLDIDMPISEELYKIIYENKNLHASISEIKSRALKEEEA